MDENVSICPDCGNELVPLGDCDCDYAGRRVTAELFRLRAELAAERERAEKRHQDEMIAHRWFARHFGEVMNGRDFSVKCQMADEKLAAAEESKAALAATLEETDKAFERFASHHGPCCDVHNSTDETAPGECELCDIDRGARRHGDPPAILAARDAEITRKVHAAYIREAGLLCDDADPRLGPTATIEDAEAWLKAHDARIAEDQRRKGAAWALRAWSKQCGHAEDPCGVLLRAADRIERGEVEVGG